MKRDKYALKTKIFKTKVKDRKLAVKPLKFGLFLFPNSLKKHKLFDQPIFKQKLLTNDLAQIPVSITSLYSNVTIRHKSHIRFSSYSLNKKSNTTIFITLFIIYRIKRLPALVPTRECHKKERGELHPLSNPISLSSSGDTASIALPELILQSL